MSLSLLLKTMERSELMFVCGLEDEIRGFVNVLDEVLDEKK